MKNWRRFIWLGIILGIICLAVQPARLAQAVSLRQDQDPTTLARQLLSKMTPEEKVGQLFLVTFRGRDVTTKDAKIIDLISNRHVGGVMLLAQNDNFSGTQTVLDDTYHMIVDLQSTRWGASQKSVSNQFGYSYIPQYVPLWIGTSQNGDLFPNDQLLSGITPLPSEMSIGATWNTDEAEKMGTILGKEMSALGINLVSGPALDLAESIGPESTYDLGTQTFGQNPFWVGEMGQAFIRGVHAGSDQKIGVIAHSFPGIGAADRSPENEVSTVRKTQEQLVQNELVPFFAVTGKANSADATADGLLLANVRYPAWQGAIRTSTRPLSFDTASLDQVLAQPPLASWRNNGGVLFSDNLGSPALHKFYDVSGQDFDPRQVVRSAFLGGSDVLYIDNLVAPGDPDSYTTLVRIIDFFVQKYREDTAFAQRVDSSVERILTLKYRQFKTFNLERVIPDSNLLNEVGVSQSDTFELARQAVTLIHPTQTDLSQVLPRPPDLRERILFLTDLVTYHQCAQCPAEPEMAVDALQSVVMRLYGPRTGGQINAANLASFSFLDLKYFLDDNKDNIPQNLEDSLNLADWVVVALLNLDPSRPESDAFRQLLAQRPELLRNKKVVVFAFGAPYVLDATDISKLSAYYALYSKTPPFLEVAARILFQELSPTGALPVTVSGAGYDLATALSPDPNQVISLEVDFPPATSATPQGTPTSTLNPAETPLGTLAPVPTVKVGDMLPLVTGVIYDHNLNPVPDGTPVTFIFTVPGGDSNISQQINTTTLKGIARASYRIQSGGSLEVRVESAPALSSKQLRINITSSGVAITAVTQTKPAPSPTITPTVTFSPTPTRTTTPTPTPSPPPRPGASDWLLSLLAAWGAAAGFFWLGRATTSSLRWAVRWGLLAAAGGLLVYTYLAAGLPGGQRVLETSGTGVLVWLTLCGSLLGWLAGFVWQRLTREPRKRY